MLDARGVVVFDCLKLNILKSAGLNCFYLYKSLGAVLGYFSDLFHPLYMLGAKLLVTNKIELEIIINKSQNMTSRLRDIHIFLSYRVASLLKIVYIRNGF